MPYNHLALNSHAREQAAIEVGFRKFVEEHDYHAVVTSFQMLSGLNQLPGLAEPRPQIHERAGNTPARLRRENQARRIFAVAHGKRHYPDGRLPLCNGRADLKHMRL